MKSLLAVFLCALPLLAIDGVVTNGTTGKPQAGVTVTIIKIGQGMETIGSVTTDAQGKFNFPQEVEGPRLLQAQYQGANYNRMLPPTMPGKDVQLEVFDSSKQPGDAKVANHMILLETDGKQTNVTETVFYNNTGKITFNDPAHGTAKIYLPPETNGEARVQVTAPNGMPIQRPAEKTSQPNVYSVNYPIKPGETRFDFNYTVPGTHFASRVLHQEGALHLVAPKGVTVKGTDVVPAGTEPTTQAQIFNVKGLQYDLTLEGSGALRGASDAASGGGAADDQQQQQGPPIQEVMPKVYDKLYWILGLALGILALGFMLLFGQQQQSESKGKSAA